MLFSVIATSALLFAVVALIMSCVALTLVVGLKNSTHRIDYVPISHEDAMDPEELEKALNKTWDEEEEDAI